MEDNFWATFIRSSSAGSISMSSKDGKAAKVNRFFAKASCDTVQVIEQLIHVKGSDWGSQHGDGLQAGIEGLVSCHFIVTRIHLPSIVSGSGEHTSYSGFQ